MPPGSKIYDHDYFEKWYRDPRHAISSRRALERKVALAVSVAEYYLARPLVNALRTREASRLPPSSTRPP